LLLCVITKFLSEPKREKKKEDKGSFLTITQRLTRRDFAAWRWEGAREGSEEQRK
jgi:hypothetical protein